MGRYMPDYYRSFKLIFHFIHWLLTQMSNVDRFVVLKNDCLCVGNAFEYLLEKYNNSSLEKDCL